MFHSKDPAGWIILIGICLGIAVMVGLFRSRSGLAGFFGGAFAWGLIALITLNFGETRWGGGAPNGLIGGVLFFMIGAVVGLVAGLLGKASLPSREEQQGQGETNKGESGSPADGLVATLCDKSQLAGFRYYTRKVEGGEIGGTYSIQDLRDRLEREILSGDDRVLKAVGQSMGKLKRAPLDEWIRLDAVFDLRCANPGDKTKGEQGAADQPATTVESK